MSRLVKDRDYLETKEGLFFCVVGYLHPPNKYTAYLKYMPSTEGIWRRGGVKYSRLIKRYHVLQVKESFKLLKKSYPQYLHYCPVRKIRMSMVPVEYIKKHYIPEERLNEIMTSGGRDVLEKEVKSLVEWIVRETGIDVKYIGVTGSILLKIHNPKFSDIDLVIYGLENVKRVKELMKKSHLDPRSPVRPFEEERMKEWCLEHAGDVKVNPKELLRIVRRRWNYGLYKGKRYFSIHAIRKDSEIREKYGDRLYEPKGEVEGIATISDSSESVFLPAIYKVEDVIIRRGERVDDILEIVSYEGMFSDVFYEGERVKFKGKLERVVDVHGYEYHRVLIGSTQVPHSYII